MVRSGDVYLCKSILNFCLYLRYTFVSSVEALDERGHRIWGLTSTTWEYELGKKKGAVKKVFWRVQNLRQNLDLWPI